MGLETTLERITIKEVANWRKSYYIHAWFVGNCNGYDPCETEYEVTADELKQLLSDCKKIKEDPIGGIKPFTTAATYGDPINAEEFDYTIKAIEKILSNNEDSTYLYSITT